MAFWIVYQGNSWERARKGGYLWAPKVGKKGQTQAYWANMEKVLPGDLIFSGVDSAPRAVSEASVPAYTTGRPDPRDDEFWYGDGWRLDVTYTDLPSPMFYRDWVPAVLGEMPALHSPFYGAGRPNQGYLYALPNSVGEYVIALAKQGGVDLPEMASNAAPSPPGGETVRRQLVSARIGQGAFRKELLARWGGRCALSSVERLELLRASHIKPWASCNNEERLDPSNGLLLSAAYDAAFDALLISFDDTGELVLAPDFPIECAVAAGVDPTSKLPSMDSAMQKYLRVHRELMHTRAARTLSGAEHHKVDLQFPL